MYKLIYLFASASTLGVLALEAPSGELLTSAPEQPKIQAAPNRTVRGGAAFIYLGGGYRGGK